MEIIIKAAPEELKNSAKLQEFAYRATRGYVPAEVIAQTDIIDGINNTITTKITVPASYFDNINALVEKHDLELTSVIRGAISLMHGLKGLAGGFLEELDGVVRMARAFTTVESRIEHNETYRYAA